MILTGPQIQRGHEVGDLVIEPFDAKSLNPNSYNFHLGARLLEQEKEGNLREMRGENDSYQLYPGILYLASTHERIGSKRHVITLLGRSSLGRLGLFLNVTADLGHVGSLSQWTLELKVVQPLTIYVGMPIGQVAFWVQLGPPGQYDGRYHLDEGPVPNRDARLQRFVNNDRLRSR